MKAKTKKPKARVTNISVSRLYNLGNYQNVKYDIAAEVPKGASAVETMRQLVHILQMLEPLRRPHSYSMFKEAIKKTNTEQSAYEKEHVKEWQEEAAAFELKRELRDKAFMALDDLGGSLIAKDAKDTWDDPDDTPF